MVLFSFSCVINGDCDDTIGTNTGNCCWVDECGKCNGDNLNINNYGRCNCETDGNVFADCAGECDGNAIIDNCGICSGGNTNIDSCTQDCFGVWGGNAPALEDISNGCDLPIGYLLLLEEGKVLYNSPFNISEFEFIVIGTGGSFTGTMTGGDANASGLIVNGLFDNSIGFVVSGNSLTNNSIPSGCGVLTELNLNFSALSLSNLLFTNSINNAIIYFEYYNCEN